MLTKDEKGQNLTLFLDRKEFLKKRDDDELREGDIIINVIGIRSIYYMKPVTKFELAEVAGAKESNDPEDDD